MKRFLQIVLIAMINAILAGCSSDLSGSQMDTSSILKQNVATDKVAAKPVLPTGPVEQTAKPVPAKKEEKVIVSINNFGRTNPFRPFEEKILSGDSSILPLLKDIPPPPVYSPNPQITSLMQTKVNGILYDATRPSAIINITQKDSAGQSISKDYLVHKGDMVLQYYIKNILSDRVVIRYGNNVYIAGIGEIVGADGKKPPLEIYPISGNTKTFGGLKKVNSAYNVKIVTPTYTSQYN